MNTKLVMTLSALFLAVLGVSFTFLPQEIASYLNVTASKTFELVLQIIGALLFGFAMLNWMAKGITIGGIYNRPIAIANLSHFMVGGLALTKALLKNPDLPYLVWVLAGLYMIFMFLFGFIFYRNPVNVQKV